MRYRALIILLALTACATPQTVLQNKNGETVICGGGTAGSTFGGIIGYRMQEDNDKQCINQYLDKGYRFVKVN